METKELFERVSVRNNIEIGITTKICQSLFDIIADEIAQENAVKITKFGIFEGKMREARVGFNPKTKESLNIPPKLYPVFRPSSTLKKKMND